jgi:hypothetical protein
VSADKRTGGDKRIEVLQGVCMKNAVVVVCSAYIQDFAGMCLDFSIDKRYAGHKKSS